MDDEMNHNRSPMLTTDPYSGSRIPVAILGGTGLSGRHVYSLLHTNPMFECVAIIGSPASAGKPYIQTWREKEAKLQKSHSALNYRPLQEPGYRPVFGESLPVPCTAEDFFASYIPANPNTPRPSRNRVKYVISTVAPSLGWIEAKMVDLGFTVVSISPAGRDPSNTFVLERSAPSVPLGLYKSPNCVACGVTPVLAAVYANAPSVESVTVTTLQSLTGRGDSPYDSELCVGSTLPVGKIEETEEYLKSELGGLFPGPDGGPLPIDVRCYRGGALRGHLVDLRISLSSASSDIDESTVVRWLEGFDPLRSYTSEAAKAKFALTTTSRPIRVDLAPTGVLQSSVLGMQVVVTNLDVSSSCVKCTVLVDNLVKGAAGAAMQIMEWVEFKERRGWGEEAEAKA